jgi:uncharacterized protein (DUF2267 family)
METACKATTSGSTTEDDATAMLRVLMQTIQTLPVNDGTFTPKQFSGSLKDTNHVDKWLEHFTYYAEFRCLSADRKLQLFKLLLTDQAADWFRALPHDIKEDSELLMAAFKERFAQNELHRWQNASSMWTRQQGEDESVDEFITAIRNLARLIPISDEEQVKFAIIKGLKRDIKQHVLQADPKTLEDITKAARIAEVAYTSTRADNKVADLTKQVTELVQHLKKSTISSIQTAHRSRSPSPRRVHFDENAKTSQGSLNADYERAEIQRSQQRQQKSENQARRESYRPDDRQKPILTNNYRSTQPQQSTDFHWRQSQTFAKMDNRPRYQLDSHQNHPTEGERHCGNCGVLYYFDHACRAIGKQCFHCRKTGHFSKVCRSKPQPTTYSNGVFRPSRQY